MRLIASFVDTYLSLNAAEAKLFERSMARGKLAPEQKEGVMEIVTSWERKGIEKGIAQGRVEGIAQGRLEAWSGERIAG